MDIDLKYIGYISWLNVGASKEGVEACLDKVLAFKDCKQEGTHTL
jgi:hypothetical protein